MDNIQINVGEKRVIINGDPNRVIVFNPSDALFAERFYNLICEFDAKLDEYKERSREIALIKDVDERGIPLNFVENLKLMKEACTFIRDRIDVLFGPGTSQIAFGDAMSLDMFVQFFEGITPLIQAVRKESMDKYMYKEPK